MHIAQREFSDEILERITQAVRDSKELTHYSLAKLVCGGVGRVDAAGRAKESSCRALLVKLVRRGLIESSMWTWTWRSPSAPRCTGNRTPNSNP